MRNTLLVVVAVAVLAVGFVFVTGDGDEGSGTSAGTTTTQETAAPAAATPAAASTTQAAAPAPAPAPKVPTLVFADGAPQGGVRELRFDKGDDVRFRVRSDVAEEIHVHGFDKTKDVEAGKSVSFAFPAEFDGKYEVEMEGSGTQIASLEIQP